MRPIILLTLTLLTLFGVAMPAQQALDPLKVDPPHYTLEADNPWTRVFREHMGPRDTMLMHQHPLPGSVIVFLTDRHNRLTYPDGTFREFSNHASELMWSAATSHRSENLDAIQFEAIQIEPRGTAATLAPIEKLDPVTIDPQHFHVEFENEYARVIRVKVGPHEKLAMHKHPDTKAVIVYLTEQNFQMTEANGKSAAHHYKAKQVRFADATPAHQDENLSDSPMELIRVELKRAR